MQNSIVFPDSSRLVKSLLSQGHYLPQPHNARLHRQRRQQFHQIWERLLRHFGNQLHPHDRPRDSGNQRQGTKTCSAAGTTRAHAGGWFGSQESRFLALIPTGGLHEVPGGEPGLVPPPLRQGGQRVQLRNFHSREGQDQIRAVQGSRRCSKRYLIPCLGLLWLISS